MVYPDIDPEPLEIWLSIMSLFRRSFNLTHSYLNSQSGACLPREAYSLLPLNVAAEILLSLSFHRSCYLLHWLLQIQLDYLGSYSWSQTLPRHAAPPVQNCWSFAILYVFLFCHTVPLYRKKAETFAEKCKTLIFKKKNKHNTNKELVST